MLLKLLDMVLVSFCITIIGAPLDIMQRHHSALGHLNLDQKIKDTGKCAERGRMRAFRL